MFTLANTGACNLTLSDIAVQLRPDLLADIPVARVPRSPVTMDMASLLAAQQLLTSANSGLTAAQQQQLLASMSSSLSQLSTSQQQQLLASLMGSSNMSGMTGMSSGQTSSGVSGLTPAQQQLLAAAGTSLTSVSGSRGGKEYSGGRAGTPTQSRSQPGLSDLSLTRPPQSSTPTAPGAPSLSQLPATNGALDPASQTKYQQLLSVIEEMSKDIR